MRSWVEIQAEYLRANYKVFTSLDGSYDLAVVLKSNAYGHGLKECYQAIESENPKWLCVAYLDEAAQLRSLGYKEQILLVAPVAREEFEQAFQLSVDIFLTHQQLVDEWVACKQRPRAHVKFDTGLSRQGFATSDATKLVKQLAPVKQDLVGICTHFANVEDVTNHEYANQQLASFGVVKKSFKDAGFSVLEHASSSASSLLLTQSRLDMCRVGISFYGFWPSAATRLSYLNLHSHVPDLKPALSWKSPIAMIKDVSKGAYVGYGCTFRAVSDMKIAVLPVGYYDGYPRLASNRAYVLIRGQRCPVVGRISMNLMVVDVSHVDAVERSDIVTLIGTDGSEVLPAEDLAEWAETIHYEVVTQIHSDIPRVLVDN